MLIKNFWLRILPYLISILTGIGIYIFTILYVKDSSLSDLIMNIAAGLLSIPIVFLSYETVRELSSRNLRTSLRSHLLFEINDILLDIIVNLRKLLSQNTPFTPEGLDLFLNMDIARIRKNIAMTDDLSKTFETDKDKLIHLLNNNDNAHVLTEAELNMLYSTANHLGILSKEIFYRDKVKDKKTLFNTIQLLLRTLDCWVDLYQDDIVNHHTFQIMS